jgi:hypothetical protein
LGAALPTDLLDLPRAVPRQLAARFDGEVADRRRRRFLFRELPDRGADGDGAGRA